ARLPPAWRCDARRHARRWNARLLTAILGLILDLERGIVSLDDFTVWKAVLRSPNGKWLASAETTQTGGFGSADICTVVYL
ncbi:MAG: hypothetical protein M3R20_00715, partial [Pseudomonadota bacterium]|nr:hypothetical protein [Pseudomonadota bacterium]